MKYISKKYQTRISQSYDRIKAVYEFADYKEPPVLIGDFNYWIEGEIPGATPSDYFSNPKSMLDFQIQKINIHMASIDDSYIPFLMPWYGTTVVPSAFGSKVVYKPNGDPVLSGAIITKPGQINDLMIPNPETDGQMAEVLQTIDLMRSETDLPIGITDAQGPLNIALSLVGIDRLFFWMYDEPELVHELMNLVTDVLIRWIRIQKERAGQNLAFPHGILLPEEYGSVWISDDDCTLISSKMYKEFVVPYNGRVFQAFNGGTLHFCGTAEHQIENFYNTPGLVGINCFCMGNYRQLLKMQQSFEDKVVLMACDFAPSDPETYYSELFKTLSTRGLIVASYISSTFELDRGKYNICHREPKAFGQRVWNAIQSNMKFMSNRTTTRER
jgi:uroporphyrinogen-III decarboxylase